MVKQLTFVPYCITDVATSLKNEATVFSITLPHAANVAVYYISYCWENNSLDVAQNCQNYLSYVLRQLVDLHISFGQNVTSGHWLRKLDPPQTK